MNILDKIVQHKTEEVKLNKSLIPIKLLESSIYFNPQPVSLKKYLCRADKYGIIAEIKRKSPAKSNINLYADVEKISIGYMQAGASALSVLTDSKYFGGSNKDLTIARKFNYCPILRKDFIIDEYQIIESKSIGADAILLIAAILTPKQIIDFTKLAHTLGMEVILELHDKRELNKYFDEVDIVGVNNRNLTTMEIDIKHSVEMYDLLPKDKIKISESGIQSSAHINYLRSVGYNGFLIGSYFMRQAQPQDACKELITDLKTSNIKNKKEIIL